MMIGGLVGATLLVAVTTIDDAIWLVPYTTSSKLSGLVRVTHAGIFVCTLEALALLCCLTANAVVRLVGDQDDLIFGVVGACLCWIIAGILFAKKAIKKRRRLMQQHSGVSEQHPPNGYGTISVNNEETQEEDEELSLSFRPWTVISFTFLGALDEISYFPALLIGGVFSAWELCLGALLAACLILLVITMFLTRCRPIIEWIDEIPLYRIVGMFAVALTVGVLVDLYRDRLN
jgi:hypothetical protein